MGQYYHAVIKTKNKKEVFGTYVDKKYMLAKLMEHSYWANPYVLAVASKLWRKKVQLAWVGDYAENDDYNWNDEFSDVYEKDVAKNTLKYNGFRLEDKFFINHTKKEFIDLDAYYKLSKEESNDMVINPISLLTAVGNGKGGGDYRGSNKELIGYWTWDIVEITDESLYVYKYDSQENVYIGTLNDKFKDYVDVTKESIFIED